MKAIFCFILGCVLLVLGPGVGMGGIVEYQIEIAPISFDVNGAPVIQDYLPAQSLYMNMASGWYSMQVDVRVRDNYIYTGTSSSPTPTALRGQRLGGGLSTYTFSLAYSEFYLSNSPIYFADEGAWGDGSAYNTASSDGILYGSVPTSFAISGASGSGSTVTLNTLRIPGTWSYSGSTSVTTSIGPETGDLGGLIGTPSYLTKMVAVGGGVLGSGTNTTPTSWTPVFNTAFHYDNRGDWRVEIDLVPDLNGTKVIQGAYDPSKPASGYGVSSSAPATVTSTSLTLETFG